ncbi:MAG TPA: Rieske (2Fe-2S) protein [Nitrososphaerales archaeon]|nr:Rieske (2Fe-2S) protein [Nitrososphaerales archaeon]
MSLNRREFLRRVVAGSGILVTGLLSSWELIQKFPQGGGQQSATESTRTVTDLQTVTVTENASGQSTQQRSSSSQTLSSSQAAPPGYVLVTALGALAGKTSAYFNHPTRGLSLLLNSGGQWRAFSATCTHAPCTVQYAGSTISCPCHGGTYNPNTGAVTGGPPPAPLPELAVLVQNANLYVTA